MKLSPTVGGSQPAVDGFLGISPPKRKTEDNIQPKNCRNSDFRERLRIQKTLDFLHVLIPQEISVSVFAGCFSYFHDFGLLGIMVQELILWFINENTLSCFMERWILS